MFAANVMDVGGWRVRRDEDLGRRWRSEGVWKDKSLFDYARDRVRAAPDQVLIIDDKRHLTAGDLYDEAKALAAWFVAAGLQPGEVVSFQLPNWYETVAITLACAMTGLVTNPIPPILRDAELAYLLPESRSRVFFIPAIFRQFDYPKMCGRIEDSMPARCTVVVVRGHSDPFQSYDDVIRGAISEADLVGADPDAVKLLMYTSGTTGRPKGVLHSHNTLLSENLLRAAWLGLGEGDATLVASSVAHVTGNLYALNMPWVSGVPAVLIDHWNPARAFDLALEHGCTMVNGAPFLAPMVEEAERRRQNLPALRYFSLGGNAVSQTLLHHASEILAPTIVFRAYGASEVPTITLGVRDPADRKHALETDGPIAGAEVIVVDPATEEQLPAGQEGEIRARGPQLFLGYARDADNEQAFDAQGYFRMGDLGRVVDGRFITITGRIKDLIIRSGENISAREIEDVLHQHPAVVEAAVVAAPHERTGEAAAAFVVLKGDAQLGFEEMSAFVRQAGLARQKTPEHLFTLEALPKNENGKVRKDALRAMARERVTSGQPS